MFYKQINIWKRRSSPEVLVYVCFERLSDGKYCVQNSEFFHAGQPGDQWNRLLNNTGELFLDDDVGLRCKWYDKLETAIRCSQ